MANKSNFILAVLVAVNIGFAVWLTILTNDIRAIKISEQAANADETSDTAKEEKINKTVSKAQSYSSQTEMTVNEEGFSPDAFQIYSGDKASVKIANKGEKTHSFAIDELDINQEIQPGASAVVVIEKEFESAQLLDFYSKTEGDQKDIFSGKIMILKR